MTVVAISRAAGSPATCGANPSSPNAATLSRMVTPSSAPATSAPYTDFGSFLLARRWATATVSNHLLAMSDHYLCLTPALERALALRSRGVRGEDLHVQGRAELALQGRYQPGQPSALAVVRKRVLRRVLLDHDE